MENIDIWNKIVSLYNENYTKEEYVLQKLWEKIFEQYFHYNSLENEIDTQRKIYLGSTERVIPDIILKKEGKDFVIVELKKSNINFNEKHEGQLFSYLKQLKTSIGILITNKINLYLYDYTKEDYEQQCVEINFTKDNGLGEKFVELFNKNNLDSKTIRDFVESNYKIKDDLLKIKSITTESFMKEILTDYYKKSGFSDFAIDEFVKSVNISIKSLKEENNHSVSVNMKQDNNFAQLHAKNKSLVSKAYNMGKNEAIKILNENNIFLTRHITFANKTGQGKYYGANVNMEYLNHDWTIILNDEYNKKLHVLKIRANTFSCNDFHIRTDRNLIVLSIDNNFVDIHPRENIENRFLDYKECTIDY